MGSVKKDWLWLFLLLGLAVTTNLSLISFYWQTQSLLEAEKSAYQDSLLILGQAIDEISDALYLQGHDLPDTMSFAGEYFPLNDLTKVKLWQRINRYKSEYSWLATLNMRFHQYKYIIDTLVNAGGHSDLIYIALTESFLKPLVTSHRGAKGFWQFIRSTARRYKLKVNYFIDERRDPVKSTYAALRYLSDLHAKFNNWPLTAAAYNMGENGLARQIKKHKTSNYFGLKLNKETADYFISILAWKWIVEKEEDYFRRFDPGFYYSPPASRDLQLKFRRNVGVAD